MTEPSSTPRRPGRVSTVLVGLLVLTVGVLVTVGLVIGQREITQRLEATDVVVDADARVLAGIQRELLLLQLELSAPRPSATEVERRARVVTRRTRDLVGTEQRAVLGEELAGLARDYRRIWLADVRPLLGSAVGGGPQAAADRREALETITVLEASYDNLAHGSEVHRRERAGAEAEDADDDLRRLLGLLSVLFAAGLAFSVAGVAVLVRTNHQRLAAVRHLESLNAELLFYSRIVQATDSALVATDVRGRVTWVNEAFERATGHRLADVLGKRPADFLAGPGTDREVLRQIASTVGRGAPVRGEVALYSAAGEESWISLDISPLHTDDGDLDGYFGVLTDITERHEAEELLTAARHAAEESAQEKAAFLATMSHEIRTPLNAVLGLTDLLLLTDLDDEQRDYTETAHQSGAHLLALVNDVLDYSALEAGRLEYADEPFSVVDVLQQTLTMFVAGAEAKGVELRLRHAPDLPARLRGDAMRLRQVLVNIVGNALKFTEHGTVSVDCEVAGRPDGDRVEVVTRVTDTGIGIPRWRIPDLFRSFVRGDASTTRQYGGTGLGLAISRRLVEAMGGTIDLESEVGAGTTVTIRMVHARVEEIRPALATTPRRLLDHSELRVLVAEDDLVNQLVVVRMLGRLGIEPAVVANGREAVEAVRLGDFDTVFMDVEMPVMDGLRAVRLIRDSDLRHQPWIVALTANALSGDRDRFLAAGMDDYVSKPVTLETLTTSLARAREVGGVG